MSFAQVTAALDQFREFMLIPDPGAAGTYAIGTNGIVRCNINSTGGVTQVLPNMGLCALLHNHTGAGNITVNDSDGNAVCNPIADQETALCFRVGAATNKRWHAVILKMGAT